MFFTYLKTFCALLCAVILCFFIERPYLGESTAEVIGNISDCFTVPGVIFAGIGVLSYISAIGGYDSFAYAFSRFALHNLWFRKRTGEYSNLYEYKAERDKRGRRWFPNMLNVGLASASLGVILLAVYFVAAM